MPREQRGDEQGERLVARDGRRRRLRARHDTREQPLDGGRESRVADGRMRELDAAASFFGGEARHERGYEIEHAPAARRARAERQAVMDFARIDHDRVAGARIDCSASAPRTMRAADDHADAELVMRVTRKRTIGIETDRFDAVVGAAVMGDTVHARSSNGRWPAETPLCAGSGAGPVRPGLRRATRGALAPERPARVRSHSRAMCLNAIRFD
ncbi:transcriptional regulator, AraC family [Burkholderia mallei]|nr:transcriptional regulator, AraC family [Burkholderia mallei]